MEMFSTHIKINFFNNQKEIDKKMIESFENNPFICV